MLQALRTIGIAEVVNKAGSKASSRLFYDAEEMAIFRKENMNLFVESMALPAGELGKVRLFLITDEDGGRIIPADYQSERYSIYLLGETRGNRPTYPSPSWPHSGNPENMLSLLHKTLMRLADDQIVQQLRTVIATLTPDVGNQAKEKKKTYLSIKTKDEDITQNLLAHLRNPPLTAQEKKDKWKILYSFRIQGKYPIDSPAVVRSFIEDREQSLKKHANTSVAGNGICNLCGYEGHVTGNAIPLNFYVLDKTTYFPGAEKATAWKVNPICFTCADLLEIGKEVVDSTLDVRLGGYGCKVIPSLIAPSETQQDIGSWLDRFRRIIEEGVVEGGGEKARKERLLSKRLGEAGVAGSYHFLIYQQPQPSQFEVIRQIDDVLPSRISEVAKAIDEVKQAFLKQPVIGNDRESFLNLSFGFLTSVFGKSAAHMSKNERTFRKREKEYFPKEISVPDLLYRIFTKHTIPWKSVVREFAGKIGQHYRNQGVDQRRIFLSGEVKRMIEVVALFRKLEVLIMTGINQVSRFESNNPALDDFVNQEGSLLTESQRQVCFLTGILFGKTEAVQFASRGSAPVHKWLKGLNLSMREMKDLMGRLVIKLKEYKSVSAEINSLANTLSVLWNRTGTWQLDKHEMRFFFTMGWTTYDRFLPSKQAGKDNQEGANDTTSE